MTACLGDRAELAPGTTLLGPAHSHSGHTMGPNAAGRPDGGAKGRSRPRSLARKEAGSCRLIPQLSETMPLTYPLLRLAKQILKTTLRGPAPGCKKLKPRLQEAETHA